MRKPDEGHRLTDIELAKLEQRIAAVYEEARESLDKTVQEYFERLKARDEHQRALLKAGKITEEQYQRWRLNQIGRGERFVALRDEMAKRYTDANAVAVAYVNDATPGVYALNRNYAAYTIEKTGADVSFTLFDEQTVKRLIVEQPDLMPYYPAKRALKRGIDLKFGKKQITASVTSGILQGKSIGKIANDLQERMQDMNRASAIRTARTAVTGAQNAGRYDSYKAAQKMGIDLEAEWLATLDNRTRHTHAILDGQRRKLDKPFVVDGKKILFPGHTLAVGELIYNCRCTLVAAVKGVDTSNGLRRAIDPVTGKSVLIPNMTFAQWQAWKEAENPYAWDVFIKKGKNLSADKKQYDKYRDILGKNAPKTFAGFQDLKYNDPEKWEYTKRFAAYKRSNPESGKVYFEANEAVKQLRADGVVKSTGTVVRAPKEIVIDHANSHAQARMQERGLTMADAQSIEKNAKFALKQQNGKVYAFYSEKGMIALSVDGELKTAAMLDDGGKKLYGEVNRVRKRHNG